MKKSNLFLSLISPVMCYTSMGAVIPKQPTFGFKISSLHTYKVSTDFSVTVTATTTNKIRVLVYIVNSVYPDGVNILDETFSKSATKNYTYDNQYTRPNNNSVKLTMIDVKSKTQQTSTHELEVVSGDTYRINDPIYTYKSASKIYSLSSGKWTITYESLVFHNFQDKYVPNYYHKLDLSNFYIERTGAIPPNLTFKRGQLLISNINNTFGSLSKDGSTVLLDLNLRKSGSTYYLEVDNDLFVNQRNLDMSFVEKEGYVKTKHLYFPLNNKKNEETYTCTIVIDGLGIDSSDFLLTFKYKSLLNIFGDCHNSEYCIVAN